MPRLSITLGLLLSTSLAACVPGALVVSPRLGISKVDQDASEVQIHAADSELSDDSATTLVSDITEQMTAVLPSSPRGAPARFRIRIEHDWHMTGWVALAAIPPIGIPILLIAQPDVSSCDDAATVDLQVGGHLYSTRVVVRDKGAPYGHAQWRDCAHHVMQAALDQFAAGTASKGGSP